MPTPRVSAANSPGEHGTGQPDLRTAVDRLLLKTPTAQLAVNGGSQPPDKRRAGGHGPTLADEVEHLLPTPAARDWKDSGDFTPHPSKRKLAHTVMGELPRPAAAPGPLLPTPRAGDGEKGGPGQRGSSGDLMLPSAVHTLLPTPGVADGGGGHLSRSGDRGGELLLPGIARALGESAALLPTPTTDPASGNGHARDLRSELLPTPAAVPYGSNQSGSPGAAVRPSLHSVVDWGDYGPAIRAHEQTFGVPAPSPFEANSKGNPRLSSAFVEWMMVMPAGHVTSTPGLTRNEQLRILGNSVVTPQAAAALDALVAAALCAP